jgi:hypothetical protein
LIDELKRCREALEQKKIIYGLWDIVSSCGSTPDSREGATACVINNNLYLFGGFSRDLFNDIRVVDIH